MLRFACILVSALLLQVPLSAQNERPRTIRVKKESLLAKAQFDNTQLKLFAIDRYGNVRDNEIVSYTLYVKSKRETTAFQGFGNDLSPEMVRYLNSQKEAVKIFFTGITALDELEHPVRLPDVIEVWFPDCSNCQPDSRKKPHRRH